MIMRLLELGFLGISSLVERGPSAYYYLLLLKCFKLDCRMFGNEAIAMEKGAPPGRNKSNKQDDTRHTAILPTEMDDRIIKCMSFYAPTPFHLISRNETSPHNHHKMPRYAQ